MDLFRRFIYAGGSGVPPLVSLVWASPYSGTGTQSCVNPLCNFIISINTSDSDGDIVTTLIQISYDAGSTWATYIPNKSSGTFTGSISTGSQMYRAICTDSEGQSTISNILVIIKNRTQYPLANYYYKAIHPDGHSSVDKVIYLDIYGDEQTQILTREPDELNNPCMLIEASSIVSTVGAITCVPEEA